MIVEGRDLVAGEVVHDLCFIVRPDQQNQGVVAGAGVDRSFAVARERHDVGGLGLVELFRATDRVDREQLPLGARPCDQLPALLVIVEGPNVFRASGRREALHLAGLGVDSVDAPIGKCTRVERVVAPERQRRDQQLARVGERLRVFSVEPVDDAVGACADERRVAALSHAVGKGNVLELGPCGDRARLHRTVGVDRCALELALEECVCAVEHEALGGPCGNRRARCENQACQRDSNIRL